MFSDQINEVRNRIKEEKQRFNISTKTLSERSKLHLPEETISRFLSGKTNDPYATTLLDVGEAVGLAPYELFMDAVTAAEFRIFLQTKSENEDRNCIIKENTELKEMLATLSSEIDLLKVQIEHKDEIIAHKSEIIELYKQLKTN